MNRTPRPSRSRRRGTVLIIVMVLLLVIVSIAGALLRSVLIDAGQSHVERQALQADRLAEAGLARAVAALKSDPAYAGESWTAPLPDGESAVVDIQIADDDAAVEVVVSYPADAVQAVRSRRRMPR